MINKKTVVVDTNVAVVANGRSSQASSECVLACVRRINGIRNAQEMLVLDTGRRIITEYAHNLSPTGQPGVGDAFLKWVLTNWKNGQLCDLVNITTCESDPTNFHEFPNEDIELRRFHKKDRKFVAVSKAHPSHPPILLSIDRLWWEFRDALERNGVKVEFLCEDDIKRIYDQRSER